MGTLLDTSVLIALERARAGLDLSTVEPVGIAAITASELLHGVHRSPLQHRAVREAFVEQVLRLLPIQPFDLKVARVHARTWADLTASGIAVGPHDLIIAATALALGWSVATYNIAEFRRVPGLVVRAPSSQRGGGELRA